VPISCYDFHEMLLGIAPSPAAVAAASQLSASVPPPASARVPFTKGSTVACRAAAKGRKEEVLVSGVMFQPFEELKGELSLVPQAGGQSLARQKFVDESEAALNEQIK
jgi:ferritin heavy chain